MKRELKVGMRGRARGYGYNGIYTTNATIKFSGEKVEIIPHTVGEANTTGMIFVCICEELLEPRNYWIHKSQFRPLKEKKKPREFWLNVYEEVVSGAYSTKQDADKFASADRLECILVKEVVGK